MLSQRVVLNGLFLLGAGCSLGHASTLVVGGANSGCSDATYTTIDAALTAAKAGDEIKVCPGLYAEQLVISKPVKLRGVDANGINGVLIQPTSISAQQQSEPGELRNSGHRHLLQPPQRGCCVSRCR